MFDQATEVGKLGQYDLGYFDLFAVRVVGGHGAGFVDADLHQVTRTVAVLVLGKNLRLVGVLGGVEGEVNVLHGGAAAPVYPGDGDAAAPGLYATGVIG